MVDLLQSYLWDLQLCPQNDIINEYEIYIKMSLLTYENTNTNWKIFKAKNTFTLPITGAASVTRL